MTMDQSLKVQAGAIKSRNVLTRAERVARMKEIDRWDEEASVVGMPKTRIGWQTQYCACRALSVGQVLSVARAARIAKCPVHIHPVGKKVSVA